MTAAASTLEIRSWPRWLEGGPPARLEAGPRTVVAATDFGLEFDKAALHINVVRLDPWFLRAVEVSAGTRYAEARPRVYHKLLQLFALAPLQRLQRKFSLSERPEQVLLTMATGSSADGLAADEDDEVVLAPLLWKDTGPAAIQRVRALFIAGHAFGLLADSGYRLVPLLERAAGRAGR